MPSFARCEAAEAAQSLTRNLPWVSDSLLNSASSAHSIVTPYRALYTAAEHVLTVASLRKRIGVECEVEEQRDLPAGHGINLWRGNWVVLHFQRQLQNDACVVKPRFSIVNVYVQAADALEDTAASPAVLHARGMVLFRVFSRTRL